jgi:hypothetical protein
LPHHEAVVRIACEFVPKREVCTHAQQLLHTNNTTALHNGKLLLKMVPACKELLVGFRRF